MQKNGNFPLIVPRAGPDLLMDLLGGHTLKKN